MGRTATGLPSPRPVVVVVVAVRELASALRVGRMV